MSHFKDSNLVRLLRLLRPEEYKKMEAWLASPWVSSNKKLLPFCKLLLQYAPSFDQDALEKERVFKKIFPGKSYHNKLLNNLITDCTRQVESFLVHESIRTDKQQTDLLRQEMLRRENTKDFESLSLKLIESLESKSVKSAEEHRELALLYMELYYQPFEHHRYHSEKDLLALMNQHLDAYYALLKCKLWHEAKDQSSITRKNNNVATNELLLLHFRNTLPNVAIPMYNLRLQRKPPITWEDFLQFKNLYFKNQHLLSPDLQRNFFYYCLNDLIRLDNLGFEQAISETLKLYQMGLESGLLIEHQQMSSVTYNNIIMASSHLGDVAFAEKFIKTYTFYLPMEIQEDAFLWASGQLAYLQKKFDTCQQLLYNNKMKDELFRIQSRITLLKAFFEQSVHHGQELEFFMNYCHSSEQFINRRKFISKLKSQSYIRLIQFAKRLILLRQDVKPTAAKWKKLSREINLEKNLTGKHWLLKKWAELYSLE